ncbi:hypothetical protein P7C70_g3097, partial [Phenoliferia sp. Uapishka_3]
MDTGGQTLVEAVEEDVDFLNLVSPVQGVSLRLSPAIEFGAQACNLLAVSNVFGWAVAAGNDGFALYSLASIRSLLASSPSHSTPDLPATLHVPTPQRVDFLRFAMGDKVVLAGMRDGTVGVWRLKNLVESNNVPNYIFPSVQSPILDLLPNPAPTSSIVVVLSTTSVQFLDIETSTLVNTFPAELQATAACWSVKGKQISIGTRQGIIGQYTPEGEKKSEIARPSDLEGEWEVRSLNWLENTVWLATYSRPTEVNQPPIHQYEVYIITQHKGAPLEYTKFFDPAPPYGLDSREGRRWIVRFKGWEPFKHLLFMANGPSTEVGTFGQTNHWATISLPDASRPALPLTAEGNSTCPMGLELDLSSPDPVLIDSGEERTEIPPCPNVLVYTSEGILVVWRLINEKGGPYAGMMKSHDVITNENAAAEVVTQTAAPPSAFAAPPSAFSTPTALPFGAPTSTNPFGAPAFGATASVGFGSSAFGSSSAFGAPSAFGSPAFGSSAFGGAAAKPSAPSTPSSGGGFAGFGTPSAFGTTSSSTPSAFAAPSSGGGFAGFGAPASFASATPLATPAFASDNPTFSKAAPFGSAPAPAFAPTTFGSAFTALATSSPGPASNALGLSTPSTFNAFAAPTGSSPFGTPATTSIFGAPAPIVNPFGTVVSKSPFGAPANKSIFGPTASGSKPATFGAAASPTSAFGTGGIATKPAFQAVARSGADDDSDQEDDMAGDDDERRVDDPPDFEPTSTGLDVQAEMANAPSSAAKVASGFSFGGLGLGGEAKKEEPKPMPSIFGNASTSSTFGAKTTPTTPSGGAFGGFGNGGAFGSSTTSAFGTAAANSPFVSASTPTNGFGSPSAPSMFGAPTASASPNPILPSASTPSATPSVSPFAPSTTPSTSFSFGNAPSPTPTPPLPSSSTSAPVPVVSIATPEPTRAITPPPPTAAASLPSPSSPVDRKQGAFQSSSVELLLPDRPSSRQSPTEDAGPATSTSSSPKSLFGFSSSPPPTPGNGNGNTSLLSRLSDAQGESSARQEDGDDEDGEEREEREENEEEYGDEYGDEYNEDGEDYEGEEEEEEYEGEQEEGEDGTGEYDEYINGDQTKDQDEAPDKSEGPEEVATTEIVKDSQPSTPPAAAPPAKTMFGASAATPSFFSKPPAVPAATTSSIASPPLSLPAKPSPFSFAPSPSAPSTSSPPTMAPAAKSPFSFANIPSKSEQPASASTSAVQPVAPASNATKPAGMFGLGKPSVFGSAGQSTAPRMSSPLSNPPTTTSKAPPPPPTFKAAAGSSTAFGFGSVVPASLTQGSTPGTSPFSLAPTPVSSPFAATSVATTARVSSVPALPPQKSTPAPSPFSFASTPTKPSFGAPTLAPAQKVSPFPAPIMQGKAPAPSPFSLTAAPMSSPSSFSLAPPQALAPVTSSSPFESQGLAPRSSAQQLSSKPFFATAPTPEEKSKLGLPMGSTATPKIGSELLNVQTPHVSEAGMTGDFLRAYLGLEEEFAILKKNTEVCKSFVQDISQPFQIPGQRPNYDDRMWSMGDLDRLKALTGEAKPAVTTLIEAAIEQKHQAAGLSSALIKSQLKREEADRFLKARIDPAFAKGVRVRQLGPEQVENQKKIRLAVEAVRTRVDQVEEHMSLLKDKVMDERLGRTSFKCVKEESEPAHSIQ